MLRVDAESGIITHVAGVGLGGFCQQDDGGPASAAFLNWPVAIAFDGVGNLYIADLLDHRVRRIDAVTGIITTIAGHPNCQSGYTGDGGAATSARLDRPSGIAVDHSGNVFISDGGQNGRIRRVDGVTGVITTIAGTGVRGFSGDGGSATDAQLDGPMALALDAAGNLYIADDGNYRARKVTASTGIITTIAGDGCCPYIWSPWVPVDGSVATDVRFNTVSAVAVDPEGNVYLSEGFSGHGVYKVDAVTGRIVTIPGTGEMPGFAIAVDTTSNIYVSGSIWDPVALVGIKTVFRVAGPNCDETGVGLVDPSQGRWHLCVVTGEIASFFFGNPGDVPFMGDWNCDGTRTPGLYRQSDGFVYLRNSNTQGVADVTFFFGNPGDVPIAGDFNGDGCDTVSIYRPSSQTFFIINQLGQDGGGLGAAEFSYVFGNPGDKPFVGDFNGNGVDTVGLHRESTGFVYFRNSHTQGVADKEFFFGNPGDRFVSGDWNGDGIDSPAVFRPSNTIFYFRHSNTQGNADSLFMWGSSVWLPVAGNFST